MGSFKLSLTRYPFTVCRENCRSCFSYCYDHQIIPLHLVLAVFFSWCFAQRLSWKQMLPHCWFLEVHLGTSCDKQPESVISFLITLESISEAELCRKNQGMTSGVILCKRQLLVGYLETSLFQDQSNVCVYSTKNIPDSLSLSSPPKET